MQNKLKEGNIPISIVEGWAKGGKGAIDIANKIVEETTNKEFVSDFAILNKEVNYIYQIEDDIKTKIQKVATKIYHSKGVIYTKEAIENIEKIEKLGYKNLPICIAKTQYSLSDDPKNLQDEGDYKINIRNVELKAGAGFIVALAGKIMTMPGLPKVPTAENIDIDDNGNCTGIF